MRIRVEREERRRQVREVMVAAEKQIGGAREGSGIWNGELESNIWEESEELWVGAC
jgi:hypothetical protein